MKAVFGNASILIINIHCLKCITNTSITVLAVSEHTCLRRVRLCNQRVWKYCATLGSVWSVTFITGASMFRLNSIIVYVLAYGILQTPPYNTIKWVERGK
jgi:hypothetical protein